MEAQLDAIDRKILSVLQRSGRASNVELAGLIAEEIQLHQIFAAAAVAGSKQLAAAKQLIAFLTSESAAATIRKGGMEPLGTRA
jgi:molybdate transport system substrate-binding protein